MADAPKPEAEVRPTLPIEVRQQLLDKLNPALDGLVEEDKRLEILNRLVTALPSRVSVTQVAEVTETAIHQGLLPAPETLERYERLHAGMAGRLLAMAEKGQQAEIDGIKDVNRRTDRYQLLALGAGFVGLIIILTFAYVMAKDGQPWVAGGMLGIGVSGIIATLVNAPFGKFVRKRERPDEAPARDASGGDERE